MFERGWWCQNRISNSNHLLLDELFKKKENKPMLGAVENLVG
jgi:hypothetical protein